MNRENTLDRRLRFLSHRKRVLHAKSMVDDSGPELRVTNCLNLANLKTDSVNYIKWAKLNIRLLVAMNNYMRRKGTTNTFPLTPLTKMLHSRIPNLMKQAKLLDERNIEIGKNILCTKGELKTRRKVIKPVQLLSDEHNTFVVPTHIISKYKNFNVPAEKSLQLKLFRPKIFMDLSVQNLRPLGRVVIELYTEASPQVVLEFVRICDAKNFSKINFLRLFPSLWLEGELDLDAKSLVNKNLEYDMRALNHGEYSGVLSFSNRYLKGFKRGFLNFSISFKPLRVLNGRRVAFGRVRVGTKILSCIQDYGTKNGKPTRQIVVVDCGLIV